MTTTPGELRPFVRALTTLDRRGLAWVTVVQLVSTATQGFGLLLLVPLLEVAGVDGQSQPSHGVITESPWVSRTLLTLGTRMEHGINDRAVPVAAQVPA